MTEHHWTDADLERLWATINDPFVRLGQRLACRADRWAGFDPDDEVLDIVDHAVWPLHSRAALWLSFRLHDFGTWRAGRAS